MRKEKYHKNTNGFLPEKPTCLFYRLLRRDMRYVDTFTYKGRLCDLYEYKGYKLYQFFRDGKFPRWRRLSWDN